MLVIGHRGAKGLAPENTLASIKIAIRNAVDVVEFDVRTTSDGVPILVHDEQIISGNKQIKIARTDFKRLKTLKPDIVTLDEVLRFIKNKVPVIIEIKPGADNYPVINCVKNRLKNEWDSKNIKIASFDFKILKEVKKELPNIKLVINESWSGVRASNRARKLNTKFIAMNQKWLWFGFIRSTSRNFKLSTYAINDPQKAHKWAKHGLYAVITDFPDRY